MRSERESTPVVTHPRFERYQRYTDSGIEWLEMVPAHWTTSKGKFLGRYVNGYAFKPDDWSVDGRPIVRIQNLTNPDASFNRFEGELDQRYREGGATSSSHGRRHWGSSSGRTKRMGG